MTNVPPQFSGIDIRTQDGLNYIDVTVSDYNSWSDIFRVQVEVLNDALTPVARVAFQQYPTNTSTVPQPAFNQTVGDYFVHDLSTASHSNQTATVPDRTDMRLTFVLSAVKGEWVNVTAMDLAGLIAYAQVQYAAGLFGGLPTVAEWVIVLVAVLVAVVVVGHRIRRDHNDQ